MKINEVTEEQGLNEIFSHGAAGFRVFNVNRKVYKSLQRTFPGTKTTFEPKERQATIYFDEPVTDEIDKKMDRFKNNWLVKTMTLNSPDENLEEDGMGKGIRIGNSYNIMKFNAMDNRRLPTEVKVVDYLKSPGRRDMVVYQGKDGKANTLAVNVFKSRMKEAERNAPVTEDDVDSAYKVFVNTHGDPEDSWATNGKSYGSVEEAAEAAKDLFMRWTAVKYWRVMDADKQTTFAEGP